MVKITLSLWDIAGQERFGFFKTDFYRGVAAVGLVFDLARPDTFEKIDEYFKEIRERSGNIPIVLVGNKSDLKESVGETITRQEIVEKMNQYDLLEYIETSAKNQHKVKELFNKLASCALLDLKPRLGEVVNKRHFRFKVLLAGTAAVGKSSLIEGFVNQAIDEDYKLTVGLDFMTREFQLPYEELPAEVQLIIKQALKKYKKYKKPIEKEAIPPIQKLKKKAAKKSIPFEASLQEASTSNPSKRHKQKVLTHRYTIISVIIVASVILILTLLQFLP